jgi:hypothetical protein
LQIDVKIGITVLGAMRSYCLKEGFPPTSKPSSERTAGLGRAHETLGCGRRIFEQFEDAQGIAFRELQTLAMTAAPCGNRLRRCHRSG